MKIKLRELVNPNILNDVKYVDFFGDSEYVDENGDLKMGYWNFCGIMNQNLKTDDSLTLDSTIDERELYEIPLDECFYEVVNDKGVLCLVKFIYEE